MIKCENVCLGYSTRAPIFENLNVSFEAPNLYVIVGASGIGKSTLLNAVLGAKKPISGLISYQGTDIYRIGNQKRAVLKRGVGYVPQNYSLIDSLSVLDNLCIASVFCDAKKDLRSEREKAEELLDRLNIVHLLRVSTGSISGGEKRRVEIARAFLKGEQAILMDEPTNDLDDDSVERLKELIETRREKGVLMLISTHDPRIMRLPKARLVAIEGKNVRCQDKAL